MQRTSRSKNRRGFTLVELMIVVGLIGLIATIAIPNFISYQSRARRSEAFTNLAGIARAYKSYYADKGRYPHMGAVTLPAPAPGYPNTQKMVWDPATEAFFNTVGWRPDGNVYYTYEVTSNCGSCTDQTCFTVVGHGDVDGKNGMGAVMFVHPVTDAAGNPTASCNSFLGYGTPIRPGTGAPVYDEPALYLGPGADLY